ncbi:MAG: hypothetical protein ACTSO7_11135 [Candidatus Heimdallarchaeota archaeon]
MPRFVAKVILVLEPSIKKDYFHQTLREISAHNKANLLEMIGVDPVIFRSNTSEGTVDLQVWVTTITGNLLNRIIMPFYFVGARKYIFICHTKNSANFVRSTFDLVYEQINALNEVIILAPKKGKSVRLNVLKSDMQKIFQERNLSNYQFKLWNDNNELIDFFDDISEDLVSNRPEHVGYMPVGFNIETVENIVQKQGYRVNHNHEVLITKREVTFRVNLEKNIVFAEMSGCEDCEYDCTVSKKLCIEIGNKGFSTLPGLGDLRILSVIFAIEDDSIFTVKGRKPDEDIENQLKELRTTYKKKCKKIE